MKYLQSDPEIASGDLTIKGTRICISDVLRMLAGGTTFEYLITKRWPWMPEQTLRGAIEEGINQLDPSLSTHA
jgi:uncharacterized protein (DUF433 family)